jgi:hypothetical protein
MEILHIYFLQPKKTSRRRSRFLSATAFTLIELLLVISLISMVGLAIYSAFNNGLKIWDRTKRFAIEEDIAIFFDRIEDDLHNAFEFSLLPFEGGMQRVNFVTILPRSTNEEENESSAEYLRQMGRVEYYWDSFNKKVFRKEAMYGQALQGNFSPPRVMIEGIEEMTFTYWKFSKRQYTADDVMDKLPAAIEIEIKYLDQAKQLQVLKRTINIPMGLKNDQ